MKMRWMGHVACMGERRNTHRVLVGKTEGKRSLGRPSSRWEDEWLFKKQDKRAWTGFFRLRIGTW
jgi:hypothetical protein